MRSSSHEEKIPVPGGHLAAFTVGEGPAIIFLHGGPGDTHDYMKRMAEPLFSRFRCIFFDQRGTGGSNSFRRTSSQFQLPLLLEDILTVQTHFKTGPCALVGHSWGAMYGLYACAQYPSAFTKAALVSMGPLDAEAGEAISLHLVSVLEESEKAKWQALRSERNAARDEGDIETVLRCDRKLMKLRVKAWVYHPELRQGFLDEYFRDPPPDREVNKLIWEPAADWFSWEKLESIQAKIWLCAGADDSTPLSQHQKVARLAPGASLTVLPQCGHIPWLDQRERFYRELEEFLE